MKPFRIAKVYAASLTLSAQSAAEAYGLVEEEELGPLAALAVFEVLVLQICCTRGQDIGFESAVEHAGAKVVALIWLSYSEPALLCRGTLRMLEQEVW